jgi:CDP-diacylglycerol---serine O-phosphatidyltransferase
MSPEPRAGVRRVVVFMPNGFTLASLFLGVWAIVLASKMEFVRAGVFVVLAGVCDALDGRVARATGTGSRFGEELDSLVDAVSFGVAPAFIMYFAVLSHEGGDWIWAFLYIAAAVVRLAKFNVEQAGRAKRYFYGLPSPAAGMTLATYYWFSQTNLYSQAWIGDIPWQQTMKYLMGVLSLLMVSSVQYPAVPTIGLKTWRGLLGTLIVFGTLVGVVAVPKEFFFPALLTYVVYGVAKTALLGLMDRRAARDNDSITPVHGIRRLAEPARVHDDFGGAESDHPGRRRRRRSRGGRTPPSNPPTGEDT